MIGQQNASCFPGVTKRETLRKSETKSMDYFTATSSTPTRPSGIPRLSRLPVPLTGPAQGLRPSPSREKLEADPGLSVSRLRTARSRESVSSISPKQPSTLGTGVNGNVRAGGKTNVVGRKVSLPRLSNSGIASSTKAKDDAVFKKPLARPPSRQQEEPTNETGSFQNGDVLHGSADPMHRKSRPSLSERTIETLSQLPPSPSPRRRQSSFYSTASPMRPSSAMSNGSRPGSSAGNHKKVPVPDFGPPAPRKRSLGPRMSLQGPGFSTPTRKSISSAIPNGTPPSTMRQSIGPGFLPSKLQPPSTPSRGLPRPSSAASNTRPKVLGITSGSKSLACRPQKPRPSINGLSLKLSPSTPTTSIVRVVPKQSVGKKSPSSSPSGPQPTPKTSKTPPKPPTSFTKSAEKPLLDTPQQLRKPSNSSLSLRETIAKAKAARRSDARKQSLSSDFPGLAVAGPGGAIDHGFDFGLPADPFGQRLSDNDNKGLLRKRIDAARTDGRLNIAAMGLKEVPEEVMKMYDVDPNAAASVEWYESVDLVRFIAADNEIEEIGDWVFPDIGPKGRTEEEIDSRGNQFGGLESLDLHGNLMKSVPNGLRRLERLSTLNLSNNKLPNDVLQIICQIQSIRDLKLANNDLSGELRSEIGQLKNLEVLDVHCNRLVSLPETFGGLTRLRILNVAENLVISLPFEALSRLPLTELIAAKNNISGALMPTNTNSLATLQILNVASNALTCLSASGKLTLPAIQQVNILANRISYLPDVSSWTQLVTLVAEDNNISEVPEGFTTLRKLRNADFTGNSFVRIDEHVGMMENLENFRVANNPLRERNFLTMATDDLKRILRGRLAPEEEFETADEFDTQEEAPIEGNGTGIPSSDDSRAWQVKASGVLDRSSSSLNTLELFEMERVAAKHEVKSVELHHNHLLLIPSALSCFATTLTSLNLAHNEFKADSYFQDRLALPQLRELNVSSNTIASLDPLLYSFDAPSLEKLDVSFNRIRALPVLRKTFPHLITLLASDNAIDELNVDAMRGLRTIDLSSNDIAHLPPRLGLIQSIRQLDLRGNRFRVPRYTILEKGTEAVLTWLRDKVPVGERAEYEEEEEDGGEGK
ncbi:hypothetical protein FGG08_002802 [Glutinoglossum americanum]|uniref:Leucine-rich repeat-containing protein 40 n=1 Tax=Glutinoglossum americanum TaxID=1670608 RepID=A0A9P8I8Z1_9PEZI|nr:hypothetical protein FGG08_002802 [Glutinoglossum americanum]